MKRKEKRTNKIINEIKKNRDLLEIIHYKLSELMHRIRKYFSNGKFK